MIRYNKFGKNNKEVFCNIRINSNEFEQIFLSL